MACTEDEQHDVDTPTRVIKHILLCFDEPRSIHFTDATPE